MSVFNRSRTSLLFSQRKQALRKRHEAASGRALLMESLEQRQLLASDFAPHHNYNDPLDVDQNYRITPRDALMIIHDINKFGSRDLPADYDRTNGAPLKDVDGDNRLTPKDALHVIHGINAGEGVGEKVEISFEVVDVNGNSLDPNPNDNVEEYQVGINSDFIIRYKVQDIQAVPAGVFQIYSDIVYENADDADREKIEVQWGEFALLEIGSQANGGTFRLSFGSQTTADIDLALDSSNRFDRDATAQNIKDAIVDLGFVQSADEVDVESLRLLDAGDSSIRNFGISFKERLARRNVPDPTLDDNSLTGADGNTPIFNITSLGNPDPSTQSSALLVAADFQELGNLDDVEYSSGPDGTLQNPAAGTYVLKDFGSFNPAFSIPEPGELYTVAEVRFKAVEAGTILLSGQFSEIEDSVLLYDPPDAVPENLIIFPLNIPINVVEDVVAVNDSFTREEDSGTTTLDVLANDQLLTGNELNITSVTQPTNATVAIAADNQSVTFRPDNNRFGEFVFSYTIANDLGATSTANVTVNVTEVNDAPSLRNNLNLGTPENTPVTFTGDDLFNPGPFETTQTVRIISATPISGETNGTLSVSGGEVTYTPTTNFNGAGVFVVVGRDNGSPVEQTTATITVNVTPVNDPPEAFSTPAGSPLTTAEDTPLTLNGPNAPFDILDASTPGPADESDQTIVFESFGTPSSGRITVNANGIAVFRPAADFNGQVTFTYTIIDNGFPALTDEGTITVSVTPVNDAPNAVDDTFNQPNFEDELELAVLANDNGGPGETGDQIRIVRVDATSTLGGSIRFSNDGSRLFYTPPVGQVDVTDTFTYTIADQDDLEDTATVSVELVPPQLPFARTDTATVDEDSTTGVTVEVLLNDLINTGESAQLVSFTQPSNGTVTLDENGTPGDPSDDRLVYVPNPNISTPDSFTYVLTDTAAGSQQSTGTVNIIFNEQNDDPTATDKTFNAQEDQERTLTATALLAGASAGPNESNQVLSVQSVTSLTAGGGSVAIVNGDVVYSPASNFNGEYRFRMVVTDDGTTNGQPDPKTATVTVTLNVAAVNDAPVAGTDTVTASEDTPATYSAQDLLANDLPGPASATDEASQNVSVVAPSGTITTAQGGTVTFANGEFTYTPAPNFNGDDSFEYEITDDGTPARTGTGTVQISVSSVNDAPVTTNIRREVFSGVAERFDFSAQVANLSPGPADEAGQTVRLVGVRANANTQGTVRLNNDGTVTYTPPTDQTITQDRFTYIVEDNGQSGGVDDPQQSEGTVIIDIQPFQFSEFSGTVWIDDDTDGTIDGDELRLGGIEVVLSGRADGSATNIAPVTKLTLADGSYSFDELGPGRYTVTVMGGPHLIDGQDIPGAQGDLDNRQNQFTIEIAAPGDVQATGYNFSYQGITASVGTIVEQLASSFYRRDESLRQKGYYGLIDENGDSAWTTKKDGFTDDLFSELIFDGRGNVLLSRIDNARDVFTAVIPRSQFVQVPDGAGNTLVRVMADADDLTWVQVDRNSSGNGLPENYLEAIQAVFAQEDWDD